jgi:ankyrin repeat protein
LYRKAMPPWPEESLDTAALLFRIAARSGNLEEIQEYYKQHGSDVVNVKDDKAYTALNLACCWHGYMDVVRYLVETCGASVEVADKDGDTPLHNACWRFRPHIIQYLVERAGADIHAVNAKGQTPLHCASSHGYLNIVRCLVDKADADVCALDVEGRTPLHAARFKRKWRVVRYLVKRWPYVS